VKNKLISCRLARRLGVIAITALCALPLCGLTVFAVEPAVGSGSTAPPTASAPPVPNQPVMSLGILGTAPPSETPAAESPVPLATDNPVTPATDVSNDNDADVTDTAPPTTPEPKTELYPVDVQTIIDGNARQIHKIYMLSATRSPADIPREGFTRDGWQYTLTDITEKRISGMDTRQHTEVISLDTNSNDLNAIIQQLATTMDYATEDGYSGVLTLDLSSVKCEEAGTKNSSYTVTATREYPHLSSSDVSLIPKTVTENGRTLQLDTVSWEAQGVVNVDYTDVPTSYRAIAKYTGTGSKTVVTGYTTTAAYSGELAKAVTGDTVYTVFFDGVSLNPTATPMPTETPSDESANESTITPTDQTGSKDTSGQSNSTNTADTALPIVGIAIGAGVLALCGGAAAFLFLRRNVKVYSDSFRTLVAKDRITAKGPAIDLSPLDGDCFCTEIDKLTAKTLNGTTIEVRNSGTVLKHKIASEGNVYRIEADFGAGMIQAIY